MSAPGIVRSLGALLDGALLALEKEDDGFMAQALALYQGGPASRILVLRAVYNPLQIKSDAANAAVQIIERVDGGHGRSPPEALLLECLQSIHSSYAQRARQLEASLLAPARAPVPSLDASPRSLQLSALFSGFQIISPSQEARVAALPASTLDLVNACLSKAHLGSLGDVAGLG